MLFDKDGTLLDYARTWTPINREIALLAAGGDPQLADVLLDLGGQDPATGAVRSGSPLAAGTHDEIAEVFASHLGGSTPPRLAAAIAAVFATAGARHAVLVDDALPVVAGLAASGVVLGVASNDTHAGIEASLGRHAGFLRHFSFLAGCDSGHGAKPGPGMLLAFAGAVGLTPDSIAVVGDAVHDLEMAAAGGAGLRVGVCGGTSPRDVLAPLADHVLERLGDLPEVLASHGGVAQG